MLLTQVSNSDELCCAFFFFFYQASQYIASERDSETDDDQWSRDVGVSQMPTVSSSRSDNTNGMALGTVHHHYYSAQDQGPRNVLEEYHKKNKPSRPPPGARLGVARAGGPVMNPQHDGMSQEQVLALTVMYKSVQRITLRKAMAKALREMKTKAPREMKTKVPREVKTKAPREVTTKAMVVQLQRPALLAV